MNVNPSDVRKVDAYTHAVVRQGTPVFLTGQVAWDIEGNVAGVGDIEAQIAQVWLNLSRVVASLGAGLEDIVKLTTYATDRSYLAAIGAERSKHFTPGAFPASTFLVVAGLADPDLLVEVEAIVMIPSGGEH